MGCEKTRDFSSNIKFQHLRFMKIQNTKISIILPNYNGDKYLEKAIQSFLDQDYENKELIIVDGKSTDNSHNIISVFEENYSNIRWIKEKDNGISNAFNIGIKFISGDIIGYLGSDDLIYKNLFNEINYISKWSDFDAVYFNSYTFYINENRCDLRKCPELSINLPNLLSYGTIVGWQNIYFKKYIYEKYKINENNKTCMDYELYLDICMNEKPLFVKSDFIGTINIFDNNISSDIFGLQKNEVINVAKKFADLINYKGKLIGKPEVEKRIFLRKIKKILLRL